MAVKQRKKKQDKCLHKNTVVRGEIDCSVSPYCCSYADNPDGHYCSREHAFTVSVCCTSCGKQLNKGETVYDIDAFVNAIVEASS